jgi:hypothetical protein
MISIMIHYVEVFCLISRIIIKIHVLISHFERVMQLAQLMTASAIGAGRPAVRLHRRCFDLYPWGLILITVMGIEAASSEVAFLLSVPAASEICSTTWRWPWAEKRVSHGAKRVSLSFAVRAEGCTPGPWRYQNGRFIASHGVNSAKISVSFAQAG